LPKHLGKNGDLNCDLDSRTGFATWICDLDLRPDFGEEFWVRRKEFIGTQDEEEEKANLCGAVTMWIRLSVDHTP